MFELYNKTSERCSKATTNIYSTSFSLGIRLIAKDFRWAIYGIYGFVRLADEIVDTFNQYDRKGLLQKFEADTYAAIEDGISLNPILHSFQKVVRQFGITNELIAPFFKSMACDLEQSTYNKDEYAGYINGSAEVVGLMCLKVFCNGDEKEYNKLKASACSLGAAFQKVNFLRDIKSDVEDRGRIYFPHLDLSQFDDKVKRDIIDDVRTDFANAYKGIRQLPLTCRFGVYTAYIYYLKLLDKIEQTQANQILENRIRVGDTEKMALLAKSYFKFKFNAL
ncbi:MAG: phytoene/squalene synthase family protein [Bacteroidota bacterium]